MIRKGDFHDYDKSKKIKDPKKIKSKKRCFKQSLSRSINNGEYQDVEYGSKEKFKQRST